MPVMPVLDGEFLLAIGSSGITLVEIATGKQKQVPGGIGHVVVSPDGKKILRMGIREDATSIDLIDLSTSKPTCPTLNLLGKVHTALFSPNGKVFLTQTTRGVNGKDIGEVRLWDSETGKPVGAFSHENAFLGATFSPDSQKIATYAVGVGERQERSQIWNVATTMPIGQVMSGRFPCFNPDGRTVLTVVGNEVLIWDANTGRPIDFKRRAHQAVVTVEGDPERIMLWAQLRYGAELDSYGIVRKLDEKTREERRKRLEELGGSPLDEQPRDSSDVDQQAAHKDQETSTAPTAAPSGSSQALTWPLAALGALLLATGAGALAFRRFKRGQTAASG